MSHQSTDLQIVPKLCGRGTKCQSNSIQIHQIQMSNVVDVYLNFDCVSISSIHLPISVCCWLLSDPTLILLVVLLISFTGELISWSKKMTTLKMNTTWFDNVSIEFEFEMQLIGFFILLDVMWLHCYSFLFFKWAKSWKTEF